MSEIDNRVSPSLHPEVVRAMGEYDLETEGVLAPTVTFFDEMYHAVIAVHEARQAAAKNPTWNEAQIIIETDRLAERKMAHIAKASFALLGNLEKGIAHIEAELSAPVKAKAAEGVARDIRTHAKAMGTEERHNFIKDALDSGDAETMSSLLGAPPYLSGLTKELQATYTRLWHERTSPDMAKRLRAFVGAQALIQKNMPILAKQLEKAVGAPPAKAKALRDARTAAEKHFVMTGA